MNLNELNYLKTRTKSLMNRAWLCALVFAFTAGPFAAASAEGPAELGEKKKIEMLISRVEQSGGTFIRNGSEHSATAAAAHMRMKWARAGSLIKTAEHFIEYIATKSSITGIAYRIKLPDGTEFKSADWLRARLAEIEKTAGDAGDDCCSVSR